MNTNILEKMKTLERKAKLRKQSHPFTKTNDDIRCEEENFEILKPTMYDMITRSVRR